jgi:hypothetical protein
VGAWWIYRLPVWKDWLFWWSLVVVFWAIAATSNEYQGEAEVQPMAIFIDGFFRTAFYFAVLVLIPAWIRNRRGA